MRASKVVAGLEPTETNLLLQAIGKALDRKLDGSEYVARLKSDKKKAGATKQSKGSTGRRDAEKPKKPGTAKPKTTPPADSKPTEPPENETAVRPEAEVVEEPAGIVEPVAVADAEVAAPPALEDKAVEEEAAPIVRPKSAKPKSAKRVPVPVRNDATTKETGGRMTFIY